MIQPLTGILPVAPTPFHADGAIDTEGMTRVLDCMIDQGVDAICILANYSEQFVLSDEERATLTRVSLEHVSGRVPVIVTTSHFSTQVVVDRAREAEALGAAMLMMMPPYHGVGLVPGEAAIFEHFAAASDAVSIPIMVQDAPLSGATLPVPLLVRMAKEIENVSYFKMETPFAADKLAALIEAGGEHIVGPFDGEEAVTLLADLDAGCTGTMTSALQPELIRPIVTEYRAGNVDAALAALSPVPNGFEGLYLELRGDALLQKGERGNARSAYDEALAAVALNAPYRGELQRKRDDLNEASSS